MLYNRFKNAFLLGEGQEVVSAGFLRSLLEEKEREEAQRWREQLKTEDVLQEVKRRMEHVHDRKEPQETGKDRTGFRLGLVIDFYVSILL